MYGVRDSVSPKLISIIRLDYTSSLIPSFPEHRRWYAFDKCSMESRYEEMNEFSDRSARLEYKQVEVWGIELLLH